MFEKFLDESYTSDMKKVFSKYLKDIGDWFANEQYASVQKMEFKEFVLDKPKALSNMYKKTDDIWDFIASARIEAEKEYHTVLNRAYIICKHNSDGVSAFATSIVGTNSFKKPENLLTLGDTDGKITRVFVSFGKYKPRSIDDDGYPYDTDDIGVAKLKKDRRDSKWNIGGRDYDRQKQVIDKIMRYNANPICKKIRSKARSLGINGFQLYATKNEGKETYSVVLNSNSLSLGDHIVDIRIDIPRSYERYLWKCDINDPIKVEVHCSFWSGTLDSNNSEEINAYFDERIEAFERVKEIGKFVEYLNTLTVEDIVVDAE